MKLCKDCKHLAANSPNGRGFADRVCVEASRRAGVNNISRVDGKPLLDIALARWAEDARKGKMECGEDAKWFEQRDPTWLEKVIARFKQ